jgi:pimeloyl-ACP methyl ester carboxylesterase
MKATPLVIATTLTALVAASLAARSYRATAVSSSPSPARSGRSAASSGATARLTWGKCPAAPVGTARDPKQLCSSIAVPLDYAHPHGRQIKIEISKIPALTSSTNHGELLLNPGGPADPGLDTPSVFAAELPTSVREDYDLIGFDPRGVEYSTPQTCKLKDPNLFDYFPYPAANGSIAANVRLAKAVATQCGENRELEFFTTRNTARDMDRIRRALGVRKISYWGQSYGTYLGTVYANMFAKRVDRMILEGNVGPTRHVWQDESGLWDQGMADRFPDAAKVAAADNKSIGIGRTVAKVTRTYLALAGHLDRTPLPLGQSAELTGTAFRGVTYALLLHNANLPILTQFWKAVRDVAEGRTTSTDRKVLEEILGGDTGSLTGVPADNTTTVFLALVCGDASWSHNIAKYAQATAASRFAFPLTDGMPDNVWPCAFWRKPIEAATEISKHGARNILLIQNRRDNATPWAGALRLHEELGRRSVLVGADNGGHYVYHAGSRCVDAAVNRYLTTGRLPKQDLYCTDVKTPK